MFFAHGLESAGKREKTNKSDGGRAHLLIADDAFALNNTHLSTKLHVFPSPFYLPTNRPRFIVNWTMKIPLPNPDTFNRTEQNIY